MQKKEHNKEKDHTFTGDDFGDRYNRCVGGQYK